VRRVLFQYRQNPELRRALFSTVGTTLAEASPYDNRWGVGLSVERAAKWGARPFPGRNLLGLLLTGIRDSMLLEKCYESERVVGGIDSWGQPSDRYMSERRLGMRGRCDNGR